MAKSSFFSEWTLYQKLFVFLLVFITGILISIWVYPLFKPVPKQPDPLDLSIQKHQQTLKNSPRDFLTEAALAQTYLQKARIENENAWYLLAEQHAHRSLKYASLNNGPAFLTLAAVAMAQHRFDEAKKWLDKAKRDPSEQANVYLTSFDLAQARGNLAQADKNVNSLKTIIERPMMTLRQGRPALLSETEVNHYRANYFVRKALLQQNLGQFKAAEQTFLQAQKVLEFTDEHFKAWYYYLRARLYAKQKRFKKAQEALQWSQNLQAEYLPATLLKLQILADQQNWQHLLNNTSSETDHPTILWQRARAALSLKKEQDANIAIDKGLIALKQAGETGHLRDKIRLLLLRTRVNPNSKQGLKQEINTYLQQELALRQDLETLLLATEVATSYGDLAALKNYKQQLKAFGPHPEIMKWQSHE